VICDAEVVLVLNAHDEITKVLERVNATGVLGNIFVASDSLTTADIPGNLRILDNLGYDSYTATNEGRTYTSECVDFVNIMGQEN
jgi:hypothetical protein